ncbi:MAG: GatB/YqeY domain-containing protein, partial [Xanthobacteraceae bacterium]
MAGGAEAHAFQHGAVGEHEHRGRDRFRPGGLCVGHRKPKKSGVPARAGQLREAIDVLREKINEAVKTAMKSQDKPRLSTLRLVNAAIKNAEIESERAGKPLAEDDLLGI